MAINDQYSLLTDVLNLHSVFFTSVQFYWIIAVLLLMVAIGLIKCKHLLLQTTLIYGKC